MTTCKSCEIRKRFGVYRAIHNNERDHLKQYKVIQYVPKLSGTVKTQTEMYDTCLFEPIEAVIFFTKEYLPFSCPVCMENKILPVLTICGHCICVQCYNTLLRQYNTLDISCPVCRTTSHYENTINGIYCSEAAYQPLSP